MEALRRCHAAHFQEATALDGSGDKALGLQQARAAILRQSLPEAHNKGFWQRARDRGL